MRALLVGLALNLWCSGANIALITAGQGAGMTYLASVMTTLVGVWFFVDLWGRK